MKLKGNLLKMKQMKKTVLVLAGAAVHSKVVRAAKQLGYRVAVTDYLSPEVSPAKQLADIALPYDIYDTDELIQWCKDNQVDGVINFCIDPAQKPAQQIAEACGLPVFGTAEHVHVLTNKNAFKAFCASCGVDTIPTYTIEDVAAGLVHYPILVKPVVCRGSRGTTVCATLEEAMAAIRVAEKVSSDGKCLIERYMNPAECQDLSISYLVKDGEPYLVSLGDRHSGRKEDNLDRQLICTIQPSRYLALYLKHADGKIKNFIRKLGIQNGPVFFQGFQDGETVRLYDPGLRFPGNEYEQILAASTGVDLMKMLTGYCVTGKITDFSPAIEGCYDLNGKICLQYMINVGPGKIAAFEGLEEIRRHPMVLDVTQKHFVGDVIEDTGDVRHRAGEISILCSRSLSEMCSVLQFIQQTLRIRDDDGKSLIISPFGPQACEQIYGGLL